MFAAKRTMSADDLKSEKVVLDPNVLDTKGTTTIDWFVPSVDGKYVAVSLSRGGSENGDLYVYGTADGKPLHIYHPNVAVKLVGSDKWIEAQ